MLKYTKEPIKELLGEALHVVAEQSLFEGYLSRPEMAQRLHVSVRTLDRWEAEHIGPPRHRMGRTVLYGVENFRKWLAEQMEKKVSVSPSKCQLGKAKKF